MYPLPNWTVIPPGDIATPTNAEAGILLDVVKTACSRAHIRYNPDQVSMAVRDLDAKRKGVLDAPAKPVAPMPEARDYRPFGQNEALDILKRLNVKIAAREMPKAASMEPGAVDAFRESCGLWDRR